MPVVTTDALKNIGRIVIDDGTGELTSDSNKLIGVFKIDDGSGIKTSDSEKLIGRVKVWDGLSPVIRTSDSDTLRGLVTLDDGTGIKTSDSRKVRGTIILQGNSLSDGNPVSSLPDSSGLGHTATQSGSACPIFKKNVINGKPVMRFVAASAQCLSMANGISGAAPWTIFAVAKRSGPTNMAHILSGVGSGTAVDNIVHSDGNMYATDLAYYVVGGAGATPSAFHVYTFQMAGGGFGNTFVDGTSTLLASGVPFDRTIGFNAIGVGNGEYSDCDIAEIVMVPQAIALLKATARQNIEATLGAKYAIPVAAGSPIDLTTVTMLGWWKADSLG